MRSNGLYLSPLLLTGRSAIGLHAGKLPKSVKGDADEWRDGSTGYSARGVADVAVRPLRSCRLVAEDHDLEATS